MGSGLLLGHDFSERDVAKSPGVVIIDETLARRWWPDENPLGNRLVMGPEKKVLEVIGVAKNAKHRSLFEAPHTFMYVPVTQTYRSAMTLLVRTAHDPTGLVAAVQRELRALDPNLPIFRIGTLAAQLSNSLMPQRLAAALVTAFGAIALLLAAIGLYGVMAYTVSQRTREIGIRMALGAQARDVLRLVVRQGMFIALFGVLLGLAAALALTRLMTSLLFGVSATDPLTFGVIALLLALVALLACYIPARRATQVDPLTALRYE
jgi:predicted permease